MLQALMICFSLFLLLSITFFLQTILYSQKIIYSKNNNLDNCTGDVGSLISREPWFSWVINQRSSRYTFGTRDHFPAPVTSCKSPRTFAAYNQSCTAGGICTTNPGGIRDMEFKEEEKNLLGGFKNQVVLSGSINQTVETLTFTSQVSLLLHSQGPPDAPVALLRQKKLSS